MPVQARRQAVLDSSGEDSSDIDDQIEPGAEIEEEAEDLGADEDADEDEQDEEEDEEEEDEEDLNDEDEVDDEEEEGEESDAGTPSFSRMTARQRSLLDENDEPLDLPDLSSIDMPSRKKKVLSVEEQRIKRAELARRRKNLSERRLEEEKQDTLDKLLKKRVGKTRKLEQRESTPVSKSRLLPLHPAITSWRSTKDGFSLSLTSERAASIP